jgi:hypothetical protein
MAKLPVAARKEPSLSLLSGHLLWDYLRRCACRRSCSLGQPKAWRRRRCAASASRMNHRAINCPTSAGAHLAECPQATTRRQHLHRDDISEYLRIRATSSKERPHVQRGEERVHLDCAPDSALPKTGTAQHVRRMIFWQKGMRRSVLGQTTTWLDGHQEHNDETM